MQLDLATLGRLFPFFFVFEEDGRIVATGPALVRAMSREISGVGLREVFTLVRPRGVELTPSGLVGLSDRACQLMVKESGLLLKGQVEAVDGRYLWCGSVVVSDPSRLKVWGVTVTDFALYDSVPDCLLHLQASQSALLDARRMADALRERGQELESARARAESASNAKSAFLAMMSHEIRTPMNGVSGMIDLLLAGELAPTHREMLNIAQACGETLRTLLDSALDFAKIEAGRLDLACEPFALARAVSEVLALHSGTAQGKGVELRCALARDLPGFVTGDEPRLRQVLGNLVGNAVKFTNAGSVAVDVDAEVADGVAKVVARITDSGCGVALDRVEQLFQPFQQADASVHRRFGGSGLGLSIARGLARRMGGDVVLETTSPGGSTFVATFVLPVADEVLGGGELSEQSLARRYAGEVLVVDDNAVNREVAGRMLAKLGVAAQLAEDGRAAVAAVRARRFDLVLMDLQMPGLDGLAATRAIHALDGQARLPVVVCSADCQSDTVAAALGAGAAEFIGKPLRLKAVVSLLERWLPEQVVTPS